MKEEQTPQTQELQPITAFSLKQLPIIEQNLIAIGKQIDAKLSELDLDNQIATEDTVQNLKRTKAELNKWFADFDAERKEVKKLILEPYNIINEQFEQQIASKLNNAESVLKKTIIEYELKIKQDKQNILIQYFNECKTLYKNDWLVWEQLGIDIKLSTTEKAYKKEIMDRLKDINDAIVMINTHQYAAEILVEYKKTLNANNAITLVMQRKEAEMAEQERMLQQRTKNRIDRLAKLGFAQNQNMFLFGALFITMDVIQTLSNADFEKRCIEFENSIAASPVMSNISNVVSAPSVAAPQKPKEPVCVACFEVKATMPVIQMLSAYLKENGIEYRNINEYKKD